jgi:hypothetical protein
MRRADAQEGSVFVLHPRGLHGVYTSRHVTKVPWERIRLLTMDLTNMTDLDKLNLQ